MTIENYIDDQLTERVFPGIVLTIKKEGKEIFHLVKGDRQTDPFREEMTRDTIFDLASLTKPLAATPVALSVLEQEKIGLSTPIGKFLPGISSKTQQITIAQLLTHTSGLKPNPEIFKLFTNPDSIDYAKADKYIDSMEPQIQPGTEILYSCTGYIFLTKIIVTITGTSLSKLFRKLITVPAGIDTLFFNPSENLKEKTAATEFCKWRNRWIRGEVHDENAYCLGGESGNAGLFGTAPGVTKLLDIFLSDGALNNKQIISPSVCRLMTTCQTNNIYPRRAAGFLMQDKDTFAGSFYNRESFGHTGFTGTSVWLDPVSKLSIVALTNRVHYGRDKTAESIKKFRETLHTLIHKEFC